MSTRIPYVPQLHPGDDLPVLDYGDALDWLDWATTSDEQPDTPDPAA